jgi:hypothetical protein
VVERDHDEGAEGPEDAGVSDAGGGALADDFGLEENFRDEVADAVGEGEQVEARVLF